MKDIFGNDSALSGLGHNIRHYRQASPGAGRLRPIRGWHYLVTYMDIPSKHTDHFYTRSHVNTSALH